MHRRGFAALLALLAGLPFLRWLKPSSAPTGLADSDLAAMADIVDQMDVPSGYNPYEHIDRLAEHPKLTRTGWPKVPHA